MPKQATLEDTNGGRLQSFEIFSLILRKYLQYYKRLDLHADTRAI